jgi:hypothetical protein
MEELHKGPMFHIGTKGEKKKTKNKKKMKKVIMMMMMMKSRRMRWAEHVVHRGRVHAVFWGGDPKGDQLGDLDVCRRDDNIKMDLQEIGWEGVDWIVLAQEWDKDEPIWAR